jgi:hypothetical protein
MEERIHEFILSKLSGDVPDDDIIFEICQQARVKWVEARSMLEEVKGDHAPEIYIRHFPIKGLLTFFFVLLGIILILGPAIYLWTMLGITEIFLDVVAGRSRVKAETILMLVHSRCVLRGWFELPSIFFTIMVGVGIVVANIKFLGETWKNLVYIMQKN